MQPDLHTTILIGAASIGFIYLLFFLINEAYDDAARNPQPRRRKKQNLPDYRRREIEEDIFWVPNEIIALNVSRELAYRLYNEVHSRSPGRSAQWIWDKVKWDIVRDRH